ncbi:unnamed protein product, partial [Ascophyllum nodosum]
SSLLPEPRTSRRTCEGGISHRPRRVGVLWERDLTALDSLRKRRSCS